MNDMDFVAGDFLYDTVPPDKTYLLHYFGTKLDAAFLNYYFVFSNLYTDHQFIVFYRNFCDHTGVACTTRWVRKLIRRFNDIEAALAEASRNFDLERVAHIRSGKATLKEF